MLLKGVLPLLLGLFLKLEIAGAYSFENITSIAELNSFFESFFALTNSTSIQEWEAGLPKPIELAEMQELIRKLYRMNDFDKIDSSLMLNYKSLNSYVNVSIVQKHFCVIHELLPKEKHRFPRMWGYTVIASKQWSRRPIHHSATHFDFDGPVCAQAADVFERTQSRTLVVAGASRYAVKGDYPSTCQPQFQTADASHNNVTMFHWVSVVLKDLAEEDMQTLGKEDDHFFIQWHGMAETSCMASDVFLSAGIQNSSIYEKNIPVTKLMLSFNRLASPSRMTANTPRQDSECRLTARTNVFGRYINNVPLNKVCRTSPKEEDISGRFVHVEQKAASRESIPLWSSVIKDAFPIAQGSQSIFKTFYLALIFVCLVFSGIL